MNIERYIELSKALLYKVPNKREKHFSFIVKGKRIISIGWNNPIPCKRAFDYGYKYGDMHSELHSILKLGEEDCSKYTIINIRLNKNGQIKMSKPCKTCQNVLKMFNFKRVFYSTNNSVNSKEFIQ